MHIELSTAVEDKLALQAALLEIDIEELVRAILMDHLGPRES